jgi:hypothetical protein
MTIGFPLGAAVFLAAVPLGALYLALGNWPARLRAPLRAILVAALCALPLFTSGPGPVQLTLGLVTGYLAIRIVALGAAASSGQRHRHDLPSVFSALASMEDILRPAPPPYRTVPVTLMLGVLGVGSCVLLLFAGADLQIWRRSRLADDLLVCLEVGVGTMGINNLIIGIRAALGRPVDGLQERPMLSASLAEFWGRRWNRLVARNLARGFFRPLCRRGWPALGVLAAFAASGVMHAVPVLAAGPLPRSIGPAVVVMFFFILHAALVLAERALGWHHPPRGGPLLLLARARTVFLFVLLSPLLLDIFADITGIHGR